VIGNFENFWKLNKTSMLISLKGVQLPPVMHFGFFHNFVELEIFFHDGWWGEPLITLTSMDENEQNKNGYY